MVKLTILRIPLAIAAFFTIMTHAQASSGQELPFITEPFHVDAQGRYHTGQNVSAAQDIETTLYFVLKPMTSVDDLRVWIDYAKTAQAQFQKNGFEGSSPHFVPYEFTTAMKFSKLVHPSSDFEWADTGICYISDTDEPLTSVDAIQEHAIMMACTSTSDTLLWYNTHAIFRAPHWTSSDKPRYSRLSALLHAFTARVYLTIGKTFSVIAPLREASDMLKKTLPAAVFCVEGDDTAETALSFCDNGVEIRTLEGTTTVENDALKNTWWGKSDLLMHGSDAYKRVVMRAEVLAAYDSNQTYEKLKITREDLLEQYRKEDELIFGYLAQITGASSSANNTNPLLQMMMAMGGAGPTKSKGKSKRTATPAPTLTPEQIAENEASFLPNHLRKKNGKKKKGGKKKRRR